MTSRPQDVPSSDSKGRWSKPVDIRQFAAQANDVATKFLNGEIDIEAARTYASIARVVVQAASSETTRARFVKEEPNLSLEMEGEIQ
jgi:hypothetical protein